jgi:hypothetical protein
MEQGSGVSRRYQCCCRRQYHRRRGTLKVAETKDRVKGYVVLVLNKLKGGLTTFQQLEK